MNEVQIEKNDKKMKRESISSKQYIEISQNANSLLNNEVTKPKTIHLNLPENHKE